MKLKQFIPLTLAVASLSMPFAPTITTWASCEIPAISQLKEAPTPRYRFLIQTNIGFYPSSSGTPYSLEVEGISSVTSISGTLTLYKQNASGSYVKIDSESIRYNGSHLITSGTLSSDGSGKYKAVFSGTLYTSSSSESVTLTSYNSY